MEVKQEWGEEKEKERGESGEKLLKVYNFRRCRIGPYEAKLIKVVIPELSQETTDI